MMMKRRGWDKVRRGEDKVRRDEEEEDMMIRILRWRRQVEERGEEEGRFMRVRQGNVWKISRRWKDKKQWIKELVSDDKGEGKSYVMSMMLHFYIVCSIPSHPIPPKRALSCHLFISSPLLYLLSPPLSPPLLSSLFLFSPLYSPPLLTTILLYSAWLFYTLLYYSVLNMYTFSCSPFQTIPIIITIVSSPVIEFVKFLEAPRQCAWFTYLTGRRVVAVS